MNERETTPLARLEERAASIPGAISDLVARGLPPVGDLSLRDRSLVVTGAGIAEGPARFLAQLCGSRARFLPISEFALRAQQGDLRVVFSQALSPHARLALDPRHDFADTLLFTSADEATVASLPTSRLLTIRLPPYDLEDGLLLRVLGPALARVAALLLGETLMGPSAVRVPTTLGSIVEAAWLRGLEMARNIEPRTLLGPAAFISQGESLEWARASSWKWMEGLWSVEPPVWDVLQFAHGPLQAVHERSFLLLCLEPPNTAHLFERLFETLHRDRHLVLRSSSTLSGPLAAFEHDVWLNAILLRALSAVDRDLGRWPAFELDGPLYRWP